MLLKRQWKRGLEKLSRSRPTRHINLFRLMANQRQLGKRYLEMREAEKLVRSLQLLVMAISGALKAPSYRNGRRLLQAQTRFQCQIQIALDSI